MTFFNHLVQIKICKSGFSRVPSKLVKKICNCNRLQLFNFRKELFARGYAGLVENWCVPSGIRSSGHPPGACSANPLETVGDAIKFYKYQSYPITDYIHFYHHGIDGLKIPAAATQNYDNEILVPEIYDNFKPDSLNDDKMLYRAGMEAYTWGINYLLPHSALVEPADVYLQSMPAIACQAKPNPL